MVSYYVAESMETKVASKITEEGRLFPHMLLQQVGLVTCLAWYNYDELIETLSGKDTLHDTVSICYQNMSVADRTTA